MKKFSTVGAALALALLSASMQAHAQSSSSAPKCEFLANAPDHHVVVRGDTLWDISERFLQNPWCWPQVWDMNREDIQNPHWIYPKQVVYFDRAAGRLRLGSSPGGMQTVKLSPGMRSTRLQDIAIPSIPPQAIEPFLSRPLIVEEDALNAAPRIVAGSDGRVFFGERDKVYARGDLKGETLFHAFRPGVPLKDPVSGKVLGYEAVYLGTLSVDKASDSKDIAHRLIVESSKEEMGAGDRLVPVPPAPLLNYVPHAPSKPVQGNVVAIYGGGLSMAGSYQIVSLNRGEKDGLDIGTVLELYRSGRVVVDKSDDEKATIKLPDEEIGKLFVFRVFPNVAYGLIMQINSPVSIGDLALSPQQ